jgi:hypothetical protein
MAKGNNQNEEDGTTTIELITPSGSKGSKRTVEYRIA